jgi:hypothetical protein
MWLKWDFAQVAGWPGWLFGQGTLQRLIAISWPSSAGLLAQISVTMIKKERDTHDTDALG